MAMSSGKKFKRGFLDGFYEIFQKDPFIVKMSGVTQENDIQVLDAILQMKEMQR